ncbi:unnamed protein product [Vitrella brassicaformis CCMP3155]|uniref:WLM domain-containing protein n=2 Tax=Vitrella brassicaformis TaxID=1169539 RepID=A0A0G4ELY6_VITBC|nr:unnamed protein product [Vitrella brassicaformis CCMP3155]|eukprot:CEL97982.1 unnamed protein product [Vitrella brassicaformis CCMP3155]
MVVLTLLFAGGGLAQRLDGVVDPGGGGETVYVRQEDGVDGLCDVYTYRVKEIRTAGYKNDGKAKRMLQDASDLVRPIMCKRRWQVELMREFKPDVKELLGLNINRGQEVKIRVRYNNDDFVPYEQVIGTVLHELVHNSIKGHNSSFWDLYEEVEAECRKLRGGKPCENECLLTDGDSNSIEEIWTRMTRCPDGFFTQPVIIGIVCAGIFVLLTTTCCCWGVRRRRIKRRRELQRLQQAANSSSRGSRRSSRRSSLQSDTEGISLQLDEREQIRIMVENQRREEEELRIALAASLSEAELQEAARSSSQTPAVVTGYPLPPPYAPQTHSQTSVAPPPAPVPAVWEDTRATETVRLPPPRPREADQASEDDEELQLALRISAMEHEMRQQHMQQHQQGRGNGNRI